MGESSNTSSSRCLDRLRNLDLKEKFRTDIVHLLKSDESQSDMRSTAVQTWIQERCEEELKRFQESLSNFNLRNRLGCSGLKLSKLNELFNDLLILAAHFFPPPLTCILDQHLGRLRGVAAILSSDAQNLSSDAGSETLRSLRLVVELKLEAIKNLFLFFTFENQAKY